MGMTITEKIIANHSGKDRVRPGQLVNARVDVALGSDPTAPLAIEQFYRSGAKRVYDPDKGGRLNGDVVSLLTCGS